LGCVTESGSQEAECRVQQGMRKAERVKQKTGTSTQRSVQHAEFGIRYRIQKITMINKIEVLNSKDKKHFLQIIKDIYGITELLEFVYFKEEDKLFVANKDLFDFGFDEYRVKSLGNYIGTFMKDGFRFSIEGSQLFGQLANKNIFEINEEERNLWILGETLNCDKSDFEDTYVLIKCGNDFIASGKIKDGKILNYISKNRKLKKVFENED